MPRGHGSQELLNELKLIRFFLEMEIYGKNGGAHKYKL